MDQLKFAINAISPMPDDDFELALPLLTHITVCKKTNVLQQGQVCKHVFFLTSGYFRLFYIDASGNEINCRFCSPGNFMVDFRSFITQTPSNYYWQAMEDAELLVFKYKDIQELYNRSRAWEHFGRLIAERVYCQLNDRVEMFEFLKPEERYKQLIDRQPELLNQISQFHVSSYLGIKPESLSRLRKRMVKK